MEFVIKQGQATLTEVLFLLSARHSDVVEKAAAALKAFLDLQAFASSEPSVAKALILPGRKLLDAQEESGKLAALAFQLEEDGENEPRAKARRTLIDDAAEEIRQCKLSLAQMRRQSFVTMIQA